jgi:hypothetical protein
VAPSCPLFIAFLTTSVNDGNDAADDIGSFDLLLVFDETLESTEDLVCDVDVEFGNIEDLTCSDGTISANGVHRLVVVVVVVGTVRTGAKNKVYDYLLLIQ